MWPAIPAGEWEGCKVATSHIFLSLSWSQHLYFSKPQHFRVILLPLQSGLTSSLLEWRRRIFQVLFQVLSSKWFRLSLSFSISKFQNGPGPSLPSRPVDFRSDPHCHFSSDLSEGELFRNWSVISINIERKWDICSLCHHTKKGP